MKKIKKNGFTLIELLIVMAIIGVLIALAIIGLRAAQSNQRDTARKDIVSQINALLQQYVANGNKPPTSVAGGTFFSASATPGAFIYEPTTCTTGISVNNSCLGIDGLTAPSSVIFPASMADCPGVGSASITSTDIPSGATANNLIMCYSQGTGSAGYELVVYLEAGSAYVLAGS